MPGKRSWSLAPKGEHAMKKPRKFSFFLTFLGKWVRKSLVTATIGAFLTLNGPSQRVHAEHLSLRNAIEKDSEGIYLSHIPGVFSVSVVETRPGQFYSGSITDPGGIVRILARHAPPKDLILEKVSKDRIRFTFAPNQNRYPDMFSFQTQTGCFTLVVWQSPPKTLPLVHMNGYTPPVKKMPAIFCGNGHHVRLEWQGPYPGH
jgi:hypothetical protein